MRFLSEPDWHELLEMEAKGIPVGRAAEVNLRNNHAQYIFTWYVPCVHQPGSFLPVHQY